MQVLGPCASSDPRVGGPVDNGQDDIIFQGTQHMHVAHTVGHIKHSGYEANSAAVDNGRSGSHVARKLWP